MTSALCPAEQIGGERREEKEEERVPPAFVLKEEGEEIKPGGDHPLTEVSIYKAALSSYFIRPYKNDILVMFIYFHVQTIIVILTRSAGYNQKVVNVNGPHFQLMSSHPPFAHCLPLPFILTTFLLLPLLIR